MPVPELAGADAAGARAAAHVRAVVLVRAVRPGRRGPGVAAAARPVARAVRRRHRGRRRLGGRHRRQHVEQRVAQHVHQARFDDHPRCVRGSSPPPPRCH